MRIMVAANFVPKNKQCQFLGSIWGAWNRWPRWQKWQKGTVLYTGLNERLVKLKKHEDPIL
jgi:hypothetical protein